jgi:cyclopropane fatty-acyl-phospholipid synthase-like methyltransferase
MSLYAKLKKAIGPAPQGILDFGCGLGYASHFLGAKGVDMNPEAIAQAKRLFPDSSFELADLEELLRQGRRYSVVTCINVLEHLEDSIRERFFAALPSLLVPEGRFIVAYDSMYHPLQLLSGLIHPGMLLTDPTHVYCWPQYRFRRLLKAHFDLESEEGGNILSRFLPLTNHFSTARIYVCRPRA